MWSFLGKATSKLEDLQDDINEADSTFSKAVSYYGEEDRGMTSTEFYGIFKTFVAAYKVYILHILGNFMLKLDFQKCQMDNMEAQKNREADERLQKAKEDRNNQSFKKSSGGNDGAADNDLLDKIINDLKHRATVNSKRRRYWKANGKTTLTNGEIDKKDGEPKFEPKLPSEGDKTMDLARDMLAALKSDSFETFTPTTPSARSDRSARRRPRRPIITEFGAEVLASPTFSERELSETEGPPEEPFVRSRTPSDHGDFGTRKDIDDDPDATIRRR